MVIIDWLDVHKDHISWTVIAMNLSLAAYNARVAWRNFRAKEVLFKIQHGTGSYKESQAVTIGELLHKLGGGPPVTSLMSPPKPIPNPTPGKIIKR